MASEIASKMLQKETERKKKILAKILDEHNYVVKYEDLNEWLDIIDEFNEAVEKE